MYGQCMQLAVFYFLYSFLFWLTFFRSQHQFIWSTLCLLYPAAHVRNHPILKNAIFSDLGHCWRLKEFWSPLLISASSTKIGLSIVMQTLHAYSLAVRFWWVLGLLPSLCAVVWYGYRAMADCGAGHRANVGVWFCCHAACGGGLLATSLVIVMIFHWNWPIRCLCSVYGFRNLFRILACYCLGCSMPRNLFRNLFRILACRSSFNSLTISVSWMWAALGSYHTVCSVFLQWQLWFNSLTTIFSWMWTTLDSYYTVICDKESW